MGIKINMLTNLSIADRIAGLHPVVSKQFSFLVFLSIKDQFYSVNCLNRLVNYSSWCQSIFHWFKSGAVPVFSIFLQ